MRIRRIFSIILFFLFLFPGTAASLDPAVRPALPETLPMENIPPDFVLLDAKGNTIYPPNQAGGQPAILWFWSIYDDSCGEGILSLRSVQERFGAENLLVLAINVDTQAGTDRIRRFLERFEKFRGKISYPVLFDQKRKVLDTIGIPRPPAAVLVDRGGRITGFFPHFNPADEAELSRSIQEMLTKAEDPQGDKLPKDNRSEMVTVTGKGALCGFFESGVWRKAFTGNNDILVELDMARNLAEQDASRQVMVSALEMLGISLLSENRENVCVDEQGIHLARDPLSTEDPVGNLIAQVSYPDYFLTVSEEERIIGNTVYSTRTVRVLVDKLAVFLRSLGYTSEPEKIRLVYVNLDPLDHKEFISALLAQSLFISACEDLEISPGQTFQTFKIHTLPENLAKEIASMDFKGLKVFVEEVTSESMEIEIWK